MEGIMIFFSNSTVCNNLSAVNCCRVGCQGLMGNVQKNTLKILIVDDFELPRRLIRNMLNELGYENHANILEAVDGVDALNVMQCNTVDLIICDWVMPNMSGLELLRTVRQDAKMAKIPFIMVTAEAEKEKIMAAIKSGVSQYIVKPFAAEALYAKIEGVMGNKRCH